MKILLTGSISLSNKGTAAIIISTIDNLKKTFPDSKVSIELFYPEKQREIIDIEKEYGVNVIRPLMQSPLTAIILFLLVIFTLPCRKLGIKSPKVKKLENYENADIIVDTSAEAFIKYYNEDFFHTAYRFLLHLYPVLMGLLLGKKVILLAHTLAPFGVFRPIMKYVIKEASLVTIRDPTSIENLRKEKIDVSKIFVCADPAFLLEVSSEDRVYEILNTEGIDLDVFRKKKKKVIGICVGRILNSEDHERLMKILSNVLNLLIKDYNAIIIFISHSSGKITRVSNDVTLGMELKRNANIEENYYVIKRDYTPQDLKGIIGKLDCLLSLRMHPVIASATMGVPFTIIAFNDKAYGLMSMIGLENNVIHINEIQEDLLINAIKKDLKANQTQKSIIKTKILHIQEKALLNFKLLRGIS